MTRIISVPALMLISEWLQSTKDNRRWIKRLALGFIALVRPARLASKPSVILLARFRPHDMDMRFAISPPFLGSH
jgi:hypothetical protein